MRPDMAVNVEIAILRTATLYSPVEYYQQFGGAFHLHSELTRWKEYLFPKRWEHYTKLYRTNFKK
jgi:hypothetical protein